MRHAACTALLLAAGCLLATASPAQPVTREMLLDLEVTDADNGCQRIVTTLAFPLAIEGYAPVGHGALLQVRLLPLQPASGQMQPIGGSEALVPEPGIATALKEVSWEGGATDAPQLLFHFTHDVAYEVTSGNDFRRLIVTVHPETTNSAPCRDNQSPKERPLR